MDSDHLTVSRTSQVKDSARDATVTDLLVARVDFYAETEPSRLYGVMPKSENLGDGFRDITYRDLASAVSRSAFWLDETLGDPETSRVFSFFGPNHDFRMAVLLLAGIKTGRTIQLCCPVTISTPGRVALLDAVDCKHVLLADTPETEGIWEGLHAELPHLKKHTIPDVSEWLNSRESQPYKYTKALESAIDDPVMNNHTSGTTGNPKPITYTNRSFLSFEALCSLSREGSPHFHHRMAGTRLLSNFNISRIPGISNYLLLPIYASVTTIFWNSSTPNDASGIASMIKWGKPSSAALTPACLEEMVNSEKHLDILSSLQTLCFGGVSVSPKTGKTLMSKIKNFFSVYGSTEMGILPIVNDRKIADWGYMAFHPASGVQFERVDSKSREGRRLYEMTIVKNAEGVPRNRDYQAVFTTQLDIDTFRTNDLWSNHPEYPDFWKPEGRMDDMISLTSGIGLLVSGKEQELQKNPAVKAALIDGNKRPRPFLLLETTEDDEGDTIKKIWPDIEKINEETHEPLQLVKELIIMAEKDKPLPVTAKGSVDRTKALDLYREEIDAAYEECTTQC